MSNVCIVTNVITIYVVFILEPTPNVDVNALALTSLKFIGIPPSASKLFTDIVNILLLYRSAKGPAGNT